MVTRLSPAALRDIEQQLSAPLFSGVPLGSAISDELLGDLYWGTEDVSPRAFVLDVLRRLRYTLRPYGSRGPRPSFPTGRIVVTWGSANFRNVQLIEPIVAELGPRRAFIVTHNESVFACFPQDVPRVAWRRAMNVDARAWRAEFRRVWPSLKRTLRDVCRRYRIPALVRNRLALALLLASQSVMGCRRFLEECRPAAILADHDRHVGWSALILAARTMSIPTCTLVHGAINEGAVGFVPVLADKVLCWGQIDRQKLIDAGVDPAQLVVTGCARVTRELASSPAGARAKIGLDPRKPVVLLATGPFCLQERLKLADSFCAAIERIDGVAGVVRLHPSESLESYAPVVRRRPAVRFLANEAWTVDEAIAAADLVVVHNSGFGSDALLKGRPVAVFDAIDFPLGHGADLVRYGACPRPKSVEELTAVVRTLLFDAGARDAALAAGRRFAEAFCAACGREAARNIVREVTRPPSGTRAGRDSFIGQDIAIP